MGGKLAHKLLQASQKLNPNEKSRSLHISLCFLSCLRVDINTTERPRFKLFSCGKSFIIFSFSALNNMDYEAGDLTIYNVLQIIL